MVNADFSYSFPPFSGLVVLRYVYIYIDNRDNQTEISSFHSYTLTKSLRPPILDGVLHAAFNISINNLLSSPADPQF